MHWLYLSVAILSEVVATSALKAADGFSRWFPSLLVVAGYGLSFHFLSLTLRTIPLGIAYAIWSGVGVALFRWWVGPSIASRWMSGPSSA
jgi:small multidrug resistance pump